MFGLSEIATRIIGIVVAVVAVFGFGYYRGHHSVQVKFDEYKAEVKSAADIQEKKVQDIQAKQDKATKETRDAFNKRLANVRNFYGLHSNGSGSLQQVSTASPGVNGFPSYTILVGQCAETTLQLKSLQDWVTSQQSVMK
jgi:hypothetical protein